MSALVASCSVAATAWLAVQTTTGAIRQEQGQNLSADAEIYNTLLGYAATHPNWDGVVDTARELARRSERRIVLTSQDRRPLFDSAAADSAADSAPGSGSAPGDAASGKLDPSAAPLPPQASAVVDPLSVDTVLVPDTTSADTDRVDPRAVGPFLLPEKERTRLRRAADANVECLGGQGIAADVVETPTGRPRIRLVSNDTDPSAELRCYSDVSDTPTATERKALRELNKLSDACLERQDREGVTLNLDLSWDRGRMRAPADARQAEAGAPLTAAVPQPTEPDRDAPTEGPEPVPSTAPGRPAVSSQYDRAVASCVASARREQLTSYVAPPALLFIDGPGAVSVPGLDLSPANTARIAGVTALVLALTVGASVIAGTRLVRPLHALTGAAQRMRDGLDSEPVPVGLDNEIGRLAAAFNDMAAHRARLEEQRKAMVSDVAHELRTPLSNIRGWLEAAQDGLADPDPAFVSSLLEEAVQLQHIVNDLQDLGAADAGVLRLHPEPVDTGDLLAQVAAAHQGLAETADVTLTHTTPPPGTPRPPLLHADPVRLRQAVSNLVSNAVRHTPAGGRVSLRAYVNGAGDEVGLEVADTGSGIPAEDVPHVFDRFWRAEKSRNRSTGGSGLGLAIVLKLAEAHGGTTTVMSTEGLGSVFTVRLPVDPGGEPGPEGSGREKTELEGPGPEGSGPEGSGPKESGRKKSGPGGHDEPTATS
ncbi:sensor histidine kinase [Streptomyces corynorhini]|uniref:histidine kinase n=1 Tax=Streptomyces corynorhini TaxID=2282652 RepID=A0A370AZ38_9ACTN|nr:sensor histidine kinase [Streptomyces corynorhini]